MPKTKQQKEQEVEQLNQSLKNAKSVVFTTFDGLNVFDSQELRNSLRNEKISYQVSKKTLLKKALADSKLEGIDINELKGNVGVAIGLEDEVAPAKLIAKFAKKHEQLQIGGGILEKQFITAAKVKELSSLPSKLELIAKTIGTIKAPISGFVNVMAGNLRGLMNVLGAIKESKNQ